MLVSNKTQFRKCAACFVSCFVKKPYVEQSVPQYVQYIVYIGEQKTYLRKSRRSIPNLYHTLFFDDYQSSSFMLDAALSSSSTLNDRKNSNNAILAISLVYYFTIDGDVPLTHTLK
jgi:hypothetical protein